MKRIYAVLASLILLAGLTLWTQPTRSQAQAGAANAIGQNSNITQIGGVSVNTDPCGSWGVAKQSVVINLASATTTQLVALSAGQTIFICGYNFTMVGAAETITFEYGTGASCGTGTTALTGAIADGTASDISVTYGGGEMTIFSTPSANALCALTTGTVGIQGVLTYVQRVAGT
jgi:hypothetical protein